MIRRVALAALLLALVAVAIGQTQTSGTWNADLNSNDPSKLQIEMHHGRNNSSGTDIAISELKGITAATIGGARSQVKFELQREEGTIQFRGEFGDNKGYGDFTFTADPNYIAAMKNLGYSDVEKDAFILCSLDVSRAFESEIRSLGFHPTLEKLITARIFRVGREQVEGLKSVGITGLSLDKLVEFKIFDVNPEYVKQMRAWQPGIGNDRLVELRIHKATPEFAKLMASEGYPNLTIDQLVAFRIHGVSPEYIHEMRAQGFKDLTADQLVSFRIFHVDKQQIDELAKEGYTGLTPDQLVTFRIHGVNTEFIEKVKKAGYSHPTPDQLVEFKIMGIRVASNSL